MYDLEAAYSEAQVIINKVKSREVRRSNVYDGIREFSIFGALEELYQEEQGKTGNSSFLLEKLVAREGLNTLVLNLYGERGEYSVSVRAGSLCDEGAEDGAPRSLWRAEDELLRYVDHEELPCILVDVLDEHPQLFYSGCVIVEVIIFLFLGLWLMLAIV